MVEVFYGKTYGNFLWKNLLKFVERSLSLLLAHKDGFLIEKIFPINSIILPCMFRPLIHLEPTFVWGVNFMFLYTVSQFLNPHLPNNLSFCL